MANVLFTRAPLSEIEDVQTTQYPVTDGQLLFDTSGSGKMYMDVGTSRLEMGGAMTIDSKLNSTSTNPIQNKAVGGVMLSTLDEINAATSKGFITDALATRALAQKIGTTDISSIGDGTCTGAISSLNANTFKTYEPNLPTIDLSGSIREKIFTLDRGIYLFYTQSSIDSVNPGDVSFTLVNKAGDNYIYLYQFVYNNIYYVYVNQSSTSLKWTKITQ